MSNTMNRRDFIKIASIGAGGVAFATPLFDFSKGEILAPDVIPGMYAKRTPTYCEICFWKCAGWVHTNDKGNIWKVTGHEDDPHSNGRL